MFRFTAASLRKLVRRASSYKAERSFVHERLEPRCLMSFAEADIVGAYDGGMARMRGNSNGIAEQGLGSAIDLPMLTGSVADGIRAGDKLYQPFDVPSWADKPLSELGPFLASKGFTDIYVSSTPDGGGNLIRATREIHFSPSGTFRVGGSTTFSYFNGNVAGEFSGSLNVTSPEMITVKFSFGVDVVDGEPSFYVADSSGLTARGLTGTAQNVRARLKLGSFVDVRAAGSVDVAGSAALMLHDPDPNPDGRIRMRDLTDLAAVVRSNVTVVVTLRDVDFTAKIKPLPDLHWRGTWRRQIENNQPKPEEERLEAPSRESLITDFARGWFDSVKKIPFLGQIGDFLDRDIALIKQKVSQILNLGELKEKFGWILDLEMHPDIEGIAGRFDEIRSRLEALGIHVNITPESIQRLIRGEPVDLVTYHPTGPTRFNFLHREWRKDLFTYGIPGLASANVQANFSLDGNWDYKVGLGISTAGMWIEEGTGIGADLTAAGGIEGNVKVFGANLASASGSANVRIEGRIGIGDPSPGDGRVYLYEIFRDGENLGQTFLDALDARLTGTAGVSLNARVKIGPIRKSWSRSKTWQLFDLRHRPRFRGPEPAATPTLPMSLGADGTLTITGSDRNEHVVLVPDEGPAVIVKWATGVDGDRNPVFSQRRFAGVTAVVLNAGAGDDRLEVGGDFNVAVRADGGDGDDNLQGGDGPDNLSGGAGDDVLAGGPGTDVLNGGDGFDVLWGGTGDDQLAGGGAGNDLHGGDGDDALTGGPLEDVLEGDGGNDRISAGAGDDDIRGGSGNDILDGGQGNDWLEGAAGNDFLTGGDGDDTIDAGDGDNRLFGGLGNDNLSAEDGRDLLQGNDGNDVLVAGTGDNILSGGGGDDRLYADDGNDILTGDAGNDLLSASFGDDRLSGGEGDDYLIGGPGANDIQGDSGSDSVELRFFAGTGVPLDRIVGGMDSDRIVIVGSLGDDEIGLEQRGSLVFRATRRDRGSFTSPGSSIVLVLPPDVELLAVDAGPGNDLVRVNPMVRKNLIINGDEGDDTLIGSRGNDTINGDEGNDVIVGGPGDDDLRGEGGADRLDGAAGNDVLDGGAGDDVLSGSAGRDISRGGPGNDRIDAGAGVIGDVLYGEDGDDVLVGGDGRDILFGGAGADAISGAGLSDVILGEDGNDSIEGGTGRDVIIGGGGDDRLAAYQFGSAGSFDLQPGVWVATYMELLARETALIATAAAYEDRAAELRRVILPLEAKELAGTLTPEEFGTLDASRRTLDAAVASLTDVENEVQIINESQNQILPHAQVVIDMILGEAGNDEVFGSVNPDLLSGGAGNDTIHHTFGNDTVQGEDGEDTYLVRATEGSDTVRVYYESTDTRPDAVYVQINNLQRVRVDLPGIETGGVEGGAGDDSIRFDFGPKAYMKAFVDGGPGNDRIDLSGFQAAAVLLGGAGNDTLIGGMSRDVVSGGDGDDMLHYSELAGQLGGQTYHDQYDGGPGSDRLILTGTEGADRIRLSGSTLSVNGVDHDLPAGAVEALEVHGGEGDDAIENGFTPSTLDTLLYGDGGNDTVIARAGTSQLHGGGGSDTFEVNSGTHRVIDDRDENQRLIVRGYRSADRITLLEAGETIVVVGNVTDTPRYLSVTAEGIGRVEVYGTDGDDVIDASALDVPVLLVGYAGDDQLFGGMGDDELHAGPGNDGAEGGSGSDTVDGGTGRNFLSGGSGDDNIYLSTTNPNEGGHDGGPGTDTLTYQPTADGTVIVYVNAYVENGRVLELRRENIEAYNIDTSGRNVTVLRGAGAGAHTRFVLHSGPIVVNGREIVAAQYRAPVLFGTTAYVHQYGGANYSSNSSEADGGLVGELPGTAGAVAAFRVEIPDYVRNLGVRYRAQRRVHTSGGGTFFWETLNWVNGPTWIGTPDNPPGPWTHWALMSFNVELTGPEAAHYDVEYWAMVGRDYVRTPVSRNGQQCAGFGPYDGGTNGGRDHMSDEIRYMAIRIVPKVSVTPATASIESGRYAATAAAGQEIPGAVLALQSPRIRATRRSLFDGLVSESQ